MKYIVNREVFLQRNISKKFEQSPYSGHDFPIYEEYSTMGKPMFSNDIGWNDSLLGRLINHIIRKIKVKLASLVQIPRLINRLNDEFERIHTNGMLLATYDADIKYQMEVIKVEIYSFIFELRQSIYNGSDVSVIKELAQSVLDNLEKSDDELENKSEMINEIKKLLDFLKNYKPSDSKPSSDSSIVNNDQFVDKYDLLVSNLTYLSKIIEQYKKINIDDSPSNSNVDSKKPVKPNVNVGTKDRVASIVDSYQSFFENVISKEQNHASQAFKKLKVQCQNLDKTLKGSKDPIVSNVELSKVISNKDSEVYKNFIIKLYVDIVKNLSGVNKTFTIPSNKLYENWNFRIDKLTTSEFSSISDKISKFAHVALLFKKEEENGNSLYNEYDFDGVDFGKNLKGYVDTMSQIKLLKVGSTTSDGGKNDKEDNKSNNDEISKYFEDNCNIISKFEVDEKIVEELEIKLKNIKLQTGFIIDGFDPIIEILRIFNQAYKLYMTQIITKRSRNLDGSSAGPSPGTLLEYTDMGSGNGPWRNNEVFDKWENAVWDIIGQRKYQVIFDKSAVLRVGDEIRKGKGPLLRKFMTDLLDGSKLYGNGSSSGDGVGAQKSLLDKYFDEPPKDVSVEPTGGTGTVDANVEMQQTINENTKKLHILNLNSPGNIYLPKLGTFFIIDATLISINEKSGSPGSKVQIFAYYISDNKIAFIRSFGTWKKLLEPVQIDKNELNNMIEKPRQDNGNPYNINYLNLSDFRILQNNKEVKITYTTKENYTKSSELVINISNIYKLCTKEEGKDMENLDLSEKMKDYKQKFQNLGIDFGFSPDSKNKIEKYTK
jgi:hypothetical protein